MTVVANISSKNMCTKRVWACGLTLAHISANGHFTASQYSAIPKHRALLTRTNQKFHHKFSVFECMKIAQNYAEVSLPSPHSYLYSKLLIFSLEGTFSLDK